MIRALPLSSILLLISVFLAGCATADPGTPRTFAACDAWIQRYGHTRPGYLNIDEWGDHAWDVARSMWDKNNDGRIDETEWVGKIGAPNAGEPNGNPRERRWAESEFRKLDRAHKGYIDRDDIARDAANDFGAHDLNRDGWVDRAECAARPRTPPQLS